MFTNQEFKIKVRLHGELIQEEAYLKTKIREMQADKLDLQSRTAMDKQELELIKSDLEYKQLVEKLATVSADLKVLYYELKYTETFLELEKYNRYV